MISDTLSDAVASINEYLNDPDYYEVYHGEIREDIVAIVTLMNTIREKIDSEWLNP